MTTARASTRNPPSGMDRAAASSARVARSASRKVTLVSPASAAHSRAAAICAGLKSTAVTRHAGLLAASTIAPIAVAAAQFQVVHRVAGARHRRRHAAQQARERDDRRRLLAIPAGRVSDVRHIAAAPLRSCRQRSQRCFCASITSASNTASAASPRRQDRTGRARQPCVPCQPRRRLGVRIKPQRRHFARRQHRIHGKPQLEPDISPGQRHQLVQRQPIRQ